MDLKYKLVGSNFEDIKWDEVFIDEEAIFAPKLGAKQLPDGRIISPPIEDLSPFLDREELLSNMIISSAATVCSKILSMAWSKNSTLPIVGITTEIFLFDIC